MSIRSTGRTGAVALDAGLTPPFETYSRAERQETSKENQRGGILGRGRGGTETFTVTVIGQSVLERQAAMLSK